MKKKKAYLGDGAREKAQRSLKEASGRLKEG